MNFFYWLNYVFIILIGKETSIVSPARKKPTFGTYTIICMEHVPCPTSPPPHTFALVSTQGGSRRPCGGCRTASALQDCRSASSWSGALAWLQRSRYREGSQAHACVCIVQYPSCVSFSLVKSRACGLFPLQLIN